MAKVRTKALARADEKKTTHHKTYIGGGSHYTANTLPMYNL